MIPLDGGRDKSSRGCVPEAPRTTLHAWDVGDVVIWDNRAVLHRARPYDPQEPRIFVHVRVAGDPRTELAETDPQHR